MSEPGHPIVANVPAAEARPVLAIDYAKPDELGRVLRPLAWLIFTIAAVALVQLFVQIIFRAVLGGWSTPFFFD